MITRIFAKTTGDFFIIEEDDAGQCSQAPELLLAGVAAEHREALDSIRENWELVDDVLNETSSSHASNPDQVLLISTIDPAGDGFVAQTETGARIPMTATELKTILNAKDIHNAKVRGVRP